jgi:hypothetical protein
MDLFRELWLSMALPMMSPTWSFISELHLVMSLWSDPTLLEGDFNMVRDRKEKSNGLVNFNLMGLFNAWICR